MDQDRYDKGMQVRRQVLGDAYVDKATASVDDFNRDFQRIEATKSGLSRVGAHTHPSAQVP